LLSYRRRTMSTPLITTRELARLIKQAGIDFVNIPAEECDHILGEYSGAGTIFGARR
jgi:iron only hydrogenase large subunit-like protein